MCMLAAICARACACARARISWQACTLMHLHPPPRRRHPRLHALTHACAVMAYIVTAYIVMAYIVMAYIVTACIVMVCIVMACIVMACIVMAYAVIAFIVMVPHGPPVHLPARAPDGRLQRAPR